LDAAGRSFCQLGCEDWGLADNLPDRENGGDLRGFCPERGWGMKGYVWRSLFPSYPVTIRPFQKSPAVYVTCTLSRPKNRKPQKTRQKQHRPSGGMADAQDLKI